MNQPLSEVYPRSLQGKIERILKVSYLFKAASSYSHISSSQYQGTVTGRFDTSRFDTSLSSRGVNRSTYLA